MTLKTLLPLLFAVCSLLASSSTQATTYYAKTAATGTGTGLSWANASTLSTALATASSGDEIWVMAGTHYPGTDSSFASSPSDNRTKTFLIARGVKVYGGFAGTETLSAQRNPTVNLTYLDGDLGTLGTTTDNAYHTVTFGPNTPSATLLEGFIVRNGNANVGGSFRNTGGGIQVFNSSTPALNRLTLTNNLGTVGAALYITNASPTINQCFIYNNTATNTGGGVHITGNSTINLATPSFTNSVITGNAAPNGGGFYFLTATSGTANATIDFCTIQDNTASSGSGGGFYCNNASGTSSPAITNSIIWGNTAAVNTSQAQFYNVSGIATTSFTIWDGGVPTGVTNGGSNSSNDPLFTNASDKDGTDNIAQTIDDGLQLSCNSPAIQAANPVSVVIVDLLGNTRPLGTGNRDCGAYETTNNTGRVYVKANATGSNNGTSWADAYTNLQTALGACLSSGAEIWVAAGTYKPTTGTDRTIGFNIPSNVKLYGGFAGNETLLGQRPTAVIGGGTNATILSGDIGTVNSTSDNTFTIVKFLDKRNITFNGFTVEKAGGGTGIYINSVSANSDSIFIENTLVQNNTASNDGAGMYIESENATARKMYFTNTVFANNNAGRFGGAMYNKGVGAGNSSLTIEMNNCVLTGNSSVTQFSVEAAAIHVDAYTSGSPALLDIRNTTVTSNTGYGVNCYYTTSKCTLKNCIVYGNTVGEIYSNSGAIPITYSNVQVGYVGTGNISAIPNFSNASDANGVDEIWGTSDDGLVLPYISPSVNTGTNTGAPATDIIGTTRPQNGANDMGAYETATITPTVSIAITAGSNPTCSGSSITFTATPTNGGNAPTYQWTKNNIDIAGETNATYTGIAGTDFVNTDVIACNMVSNAPNANPTTATSNNIALTINTLSFTCPADITTNVTQACYAVVNFSNPTVSSGCSGATVTQISGLPSGSMFPVGSTQITFQANNNGNIVTCSFYVTVNSIPSSISYSSSVFCKPTVSTIISPTITGLTGGTFSSTSGLAINGSTGNIDLFTSNAGSYTITYSDGNCIDTFTNITINETISRIYVKANATGANNGTSWSDAYTDLQSALNTTCFAANAEIWVAQGTYKPTTGSDRTIYFNVPNNVKLYGGFVGTETAINQRPAATYQGIGGVVEGSNALTILSGDIGTPNDSTDNSYHIMVVANATSATLIDGFTFTKGNASSSSTFLSGLGTNDRGAGLYAYNNGSNLTLINLTFSNNTVTGGGAYFNTGTSPTISQCVWQQNSSVVTGGSNSSAILTLSGNLSLSQCSFVQNSSTGDGTVYLGSNGSTHSFSKCLFNSNTAQGRGGAIYYQQNLNIQISQSVFVNNSASGHGGAVRFGNGVQTVDNCVFANNTANGFGGAMLTGANTSIRNSIFYGNNGALQGGAIINYNNSTISNSIIYNNTAPTGAGIHVASGTPTVEYSNVQGGFTGTGNINSNPLFVNTNDLDGADNNWGTNDDGLALQTGSPSINTGTNTGVSITDITGAARTICTTTDMGAYENTGATRLYVKANATGANNGTSWADAYTNLQSALTGCLATGAEIWVANGTYLPTADANGNTSPADNRDKTFYLPDGIKLYGGFAGTETTLAQRVLPAKGGSSSCILSGDLGTPNDSTDNAYHIITAYKHATSYGVTINGFTIKRGTANGSGNFIITAGGGFQRDRAAALFVYDLPTTIENNSFQNNYGESVAGTIYVYANNDANSTQPFSGRFANNIVSLNNAAAPTVYFNYGRKYIYNNSFGYNNSSNTTAGIYVSGGRDSVISNQFLNNTVASTVRAGYMANSMDTVYAVNNVFASNSSSSTSITGLSMRVATNSSATNYTNISSNVFYGNNGGYNPGLEIQAGTHTNIVRNNSFVKNTFTAVGGTMNGALWLSNGSYTVENNVFTGNNKNGNYTLAGIDYYGSGSTAPVFRNNILQRAETDFAYTATGITALGTSATGNLFTQNAYLINIEDGDGADDTWGTADDGLIPTGCSIARNAGLNAGVVATDIAGTSRPQFTTTDIGAYETTLQPIAARVYVKVNATGNNDGTSWTNAFTSLQSVLQACVQPGVEVWVAAGTYKPTTTTNRNIGFIVPSGMKLYGGFAGTETSFSQRPINVVGGGANATILSGNIGNTNDSTDNTINLITAYNAAKGTVMDGFTIQDGYETNMVSNKAAGLTITASNGRNELQVSNCIFKNNSGNYAAFNNGDAVVINSENAGVAKTKICNNIFVNNRAFWSSAIRIISEGDSSISSISNNIFYQNKNEQGGTILTGWNNGFDRDTISNNTFYDNSTTNGTSIISVDTRIVLFNNIIWNNTGTNLFSSTSNLEANYNNIQNTQLNGIGTGNIVANPVFVNESSPLGTDNLWATADDGLQIASTSPSANTGTGTNAVATDIVGTARPQGAGVDMGAYEAFFETVWNGVTWSNGTPTSTINAIINSSTAPASFTCKALTINNGVALTITGITATTNGNIINNGNGIAGIGTLNIAANSSLSGSAIHFNGVLLVNSGATLTTNSLLVLTSNATNTAQVGVVAGSISGLVQTERFIPAKRAFRLLTPGVTTTGSIKANWQEGSTSNIHNPNAGYGTHITGSTIDQANGFDGTLTGNPSLYTFVPGTQTYAPIANTNVLGLTAGVGYRILIRGSRSISLATNTPIPDNTVLRATGNLLTGSIIYNASSTPSLATAANAFSMVGNPYWAQVDWHAITKTDVGNAYWIWDPNLNGSNNRGAFVSYSQTTGITSDGSSAMSRYIQPGQAFFVQNNPAVTAPSLVFAESNKNTNATQTNTFRTSNANDGVLYTRLYTLGNNTHADGTALVFGSNYQKTVITNEDVSKLGNLDENIALKYGNQYLSIAAQPLPNQTDTVQLALYNLLSNQYMIEVEGRGFAQVFEGWLVDTYMNQRIAIDMQGSVKLSFATDSSAASKNINRFILVFNKQHPVISITNSLQVNPNPASSFINATFAPQLQPASLRLIDAGGLIVASYIAAAQATQYKIPVQQLAAGTYTLQLVTADGAQVQLFFKQ